MVFTTIAIPLGAGLARFALSQATSRWSMFKNIYNKSSQHPLGFGILYAGGTTIGYHANPLNWRDNYKYVGRPQYVSRL